MPITAADLRRDLSQRNQTRAVSHAHEATYSETPSIVYQPDGDSHGNFHPSSYRRILSNPDWSNRLTKAYTASKRIAYSNTRSRRELDCANSSDALLMNVFCYPGILRRPQLCALLGIDPNLKPIFGHHPNTPLHRNLADRTEVDMALGHLLVEAKLTETGFQTARPSLLQRYRDLDEVFYVEDLPTTPNGSFLHYQLIRGALAAHHTGLTYLVLCDGRRTAQHEAWYSILRTVRAADLRSRLALLTWQELARTLPRSLQTFLAEKYGLTAI